MVSAHHTAACRNQPRALQDEGGPAEGDAREEAGTLTISTPISTGARERAPTQAPPYDSTQLWAGAAAGTVGGSMPGGGMLGCGTAGGGIPGGAMPEGAMPCLPGGGMPGGDRAGLGGAKPGGGMPGMPAGDMPGSGMPGLGGAKPVGIIGSIIGG